MKINYFMFTAEMAKWLLRTREGLKMPQSEVGSHVGLAQGFLSKYERGDAVKIASDRWAKLVSLYTSKGAKPIDAKHDPAKLTPDPGALLRELKALKKQTGSSWAGLAATLKIDKSDLIRFQKDGQVGTDRLIQINQGLQALKRLPQKLVEAGVAEPPKPPVKKPKKAKAKKHAEAAPKKSLIHPAVPNIPTMTALRLRELQLVRALQNDIEAHNLGDILNGSAAKLLNG